MAAREAVKLGIVLERRKSESPWQDHAWRAVAAVAEAPELPEWRELARGPGWQRFYCGAHEVELHSRETPNYRENLMSERPAVYIVLRPPAAGPNPIDIALVTLSAQEASACGEGDGCAVDSVPIPARVRAWADAFVARHHVEEVFVKRKRKRYDPDQADLGRAPTGGRFSDTGRRGRRDG